LLVAGFMCLGIFLRIYNFWKLGLTIDEYGTWWVVAGENWRDVLRRAFYSQGQSPFYYFIAKLSSDLLGANAASFRLPSILFGIGVVGLAYPLAIRIFRDRHAALLALAAFAVNQRLILYSQDARPYSLALLCTMLSFLFYLSLLTRERLWYRIGYLVATAGVYYAHYLFSFVVVIQVLHLFLIRGWSWLQSRAWYITFAVLALVCLPGGVQLSGLFVHRESWDYVKRTGVFGPVKLAMDFLDPWAFFPVAFLVLAISIVSREKEKPRYRGLDLVLMWFLAPVALICTIPPLFGVSLLNTRYLLVSLPAAIFFVVWVMAIERRTFWRKWIPLVAFLTLTFVWTLIPALHETGNFSRRPDEGWKRAADFLEKQARDDDLVMYSAGFIQTDRLALPNPDPLLVSFVSWPLSANLSANHKYHMVGLPTRDSTQTAAYISSSLKKATESRRVWIIGRGELIPKAALALLRTDHFLIRERTSYGSVKLFLLEQSGSGK